MMALCVTLVGAARRAEAQDRHVVPPRLLDEPVASWPSGVSHERDVTVTLVLTIRTDGSVGHAEVLEGVSPEVDAAAIAAAERWRFEPATRGGKAVAARVRAQVQVRARATPAAPADRQATPPPLVTPARRATPAPAPAPAADDDAPELQVIGRVRRPTLGASDHDVHVGELQRVPRRGAAELLTLTPGVFLAREGGDGHAERVYLRGFDARNGQDIEFSVAGVPVNEAGNLHGNGYADLGFVIPELVESLRVLEGPLDPRQGNFAVAGSADYQLGLERRGLTTQVTAGSFGSQRLLLTWGPADLGPETFAGAEIASTDGYGQNRDARRGRAQGQYQGALGRTGTWRVGASAYFDEYHSAGVLRADDVASGRKGFFDTYDTGQGGGGTRLSTYADLQARHGSTVYAGQIFAIRRTSRVRENFTGFLQDAQEARQEPHEQRGDLADIAMSETTLGSRGSARLRSDALGEPQELELGYFARGDVVEGTRQRLAAGSGVPYVTEVDLRSSLGDLGLYADATLRPWHWFALRGGARAELLTYDVLDACAVQDVSRPSPASPPGDASCLSQQRFGAYREPTQRSSTAATKLMPRANLLFGPFEHFLFSLGYGTGVRSIDPSYVTQDVATPFASIAAYDGGVTYAQSFTALRIEARSSFFVTHVDRDLVFSESEGRNVLGGGTTRTGWSGSARVTGDFFDQSANVTLVRSRFDDTHLLVPYAPDVVVRSDSAVFQDLPVRVAGSAVRALGGLGVSYVGRRALPYGQRSDALVTLDGSVGAAWSAFELGVQARNLLDTRYRSAEYNYVSDFHSQAAPTLVPARHFVAGPPREIFVTLAVTLGAT